MQAALEAEITEFLGRDRYQRAAACEDARPGSRNGYREVTVKTTAGPVTLARPKLRGTTEAFASRLFGVACDQDERAGDAGDRLVRARPVRPRRRGRPGRGAGRPGRDLQVHRVVGLPARSRRSTPPGPGAAWTGSRWTTCSWTPRSSGCTPAPRPSRCWPPGASPPAASPRSSAWRPAAASPPTPGTTSSRPQGPRPGLPAAGHLRRRARPDRRDRAGLPQGTTSKVSYSSSQECPGQGPGRDAGRGQGRLLGPLRHRGPEDPARPPARRAG